jgi:ABC-type transport system substrate-binding protein
VSDRRRHLAACVLLALLLSLGLLASGCTGRGAAPDVIRVGVIGNVASLSPIYDRSPSAMVVDDLAFRGFLDWTEEGTLRADWARDVPSRAARTFRGNAEMAAYTLTLRPDAKWSDGAPLTNDDFMFTWRVMLHPLFKDAQAWWSQYVRGFNSVGDALTFTVSRSPDHDGLDLFPLPLHLLEKGLNTDALNFASLPFNKGLPVGDGPFRFTRRRYNGVDLEANPFYLPRPPKVKNVYVQFYATADEAWSALNRNAVDAIDQVPLDSLGNVADTSAVKIATVAGPHLITGVFNTRMAPFDRVSLRRALAFAVDRRLIVRAAGAGAVTTQSWLQPSRAGYLPAFGGYRFDPARAERSLRASGWVIDDRGRLSPAAEGPRGTDEAPEMPSDGASGSPEASGASDPSGTPGAEAPPSDQKRPRSSRKSVELTILYDSGNPRTEAAAKQLQAAWARLGLQPVLIGRPHASFEAEIRQGSYLVAVDDFEVYPWTEPWTWFAKESIPTDTNNFRGDNVAAWSTTESGRLLRKIAAEAFPAAAAPLLREHQRLLAREVPILPLYFVPLATAYRSGLLGLKPRSFGAATWNIEEWSWK